MKIVEVAYMKPVEKWFEVVDTFKVLRRNWLVNLMLKFFVKRKWIDDEVKYKKIEYHYFNIDDLAELVHEQIIEYRRMTGKQPRKLIVGYEQHKQLLKEASTIWCTVDLSRADKTYYGLEIELNPLINGMVVTGE